MPIEVWRTSLYSEEVLKTIQVRNVPEAVHRMLKTRAAGEGMSLSDFIKRELGRTLERPTMREWLAQTGQAKPIKASRSAAQIIRELRDTR